MFLYPLAHSSGLPFSKILMYVYSYPKLVYTYKDSKNIFKNLLEND